MRETHQAAVALVLSVLLNAISVHAAGSGTEQSTVSQPVAGSSAPATTARLVRPIGTIDFYGLHQLSADHLRSVLTFKVGDSITVGDHSFFDASKQNLITVPGVLRVQSNALCCGAAGSVTIYIGIEEKNTPAMIFRPAPTGSIRLPPEVVRTGGEFEKLHMQAILNGHSEEDDSEGHSLLPNFPAARPIEDRVLAIAHNELPLLRQVLRESADSEHRALAAELLGYSDDLQSVVPDLVYAMRDSSEGVRNDAMRALWVFSMATKVRRPRVPYKPFVALLNSPFWTDRNKASLALMTIATKRDPVLLRMLRAQALPSLVEMARWSDQGHALPAYRILGAIAGLTDKDIDGDWSRGDREAVIRSALGR
jgi:hypothetical protein